jgi:basic amino acid/polyamine antiporter, APA family
VHDSIAMSDEEGGLKRALGLPGLTFYGVGIILGAGIYSVLGAAAGRAGNWVWLSFFVSSAVALLTALSYAELSTTYPRASAEFTYLRRALPRFPGVALVTGLLVALSGAATTATVAISFAGYLQSFVDLPAALVALGVIAAAAGLNLVGIKESGWVNIAFTLLEAGGLVIFIVLGARSDHLARAFMAAPPPGVIAGAALVFFSFLGFENIANLAEESKKPERDLPRAILLSLAISTVLYVAVAVAAVALLPPAQLADAQAPLADAARAGSPRIAGILGGIALFATANTALVSMLVASRVLFGMARERELPRALSRLLPGRKTPWVAILAVTAVSAALLPFGKVGVVASTSSFAQLLAFAAVNLALIVLRYREPRKKRPFHVPGAIGRFPIFPALGVLTTLGIATQLDRHALIGGTCALGLLTAYSLWKNRCHAR